MYETFYKIDAREFKRLLNKYGRKKTGWIVSEIISWVLYIIGAAVVVIPCVFMRDVSMASLVLIDAAAVICSVAIIATGYAIGRIGRRKSGEPYEKMERPFLGTNSDGVVFGFHNKYAETQYSCNRSGMRVESTDLYRIKYQNINIVKINKTNHTIEIRGRIELIEYDDIAEERIRHSYTDGQFGDDSAISIFDCVENLNAFIEALKRNSVMIVYD